MPILRIMRRSADGAPGPPESLASAEIAYNEADGVLYYGKGDDGQGQATEIVSIGGEELFREIAEELKELRDQVEQLQGDLIRARLEQDES